MIILENLDKYVWVAWIVAGVILLITEIFTEGFVASLIGIAAIVTGVAALLIDSFIIQSGIFLILLIIFMALVRPIVKKYFDNKPESDKKSNVDAMIGREVLVHETIDNIHNKGYVKVGSDYLKAHSVAETIIEKGEIVVIEKIVGITAHVTVAPKKAEGTGSAVAGGVDSGDGSEPPEQNGAEES